MNEISVEPSGKKYNNVNRTIAWLRWLFIILFSPAFFLMHKTPTSLLVFFLTLTITIMYNTLATRYILRCGQKGKKIKTLIAYIDVVLISIFSYQFGGLNSDIFVLLSFVIGYCGINSDDSRAKRVGVFSVVTYSFSTVFWAKTNDVQLDYWKLGMRDLFIILAVYSISFIVREVRRYDEMHKKEFKLARTDSLTGLANRHYFDQKLDEEVYYADSTGNPINVLMFDLDNFKSFNDTYGHVWGDKLLAMFADIIKHTIRKSDIPVRYGGEEFLILIRDLDIETAKLLGDKIRKELEKQHIYAGIGEYKKNITVSCGVAQYPTHSFSIKEVIDFADKALYQAKENGKNMVVSYESGDDPLTHAPKAIIKTS